MDEDSMGRITISSLEAKIKQLEARALEQATAENALRAERDAARADADAARADADAARADAQAAVAAAAANAGDNHAAPGMIPKPRGKFSLRQAMGLGDPEKKIQYRAIQRTIHELVILASINWKLDYRKQDPIKLGNLFQAANEDHPILATFENNWATAELIKQFLQNRRKYAYSLGILPSPGRRRRRNHQ
ncbi:hypothetical protein BC629DRAFT_1598034 [Irpex lacteus]|nr:hypothetical protein BC629DRAFT_1598034 [Irpex lacteus]